MKKRQRGEIAVIYAGWTLIAALLGYGLYREVTGYEHKAGVEHRMAEPGQAPLASR